MNYQYLKTIAQPHRLDITLNNPPVNILTAAVMREIIDALNTASDDNTIRLVVIRGEGKAWSAGADVSEHLPGRFEEMLEVFGSLCEHLRTYSKPTIAAVDGMCLGGGCEVACMCDFVIATERSKFGQPEIKVGVFPPAACAHFARKIGLGRALEIILTGDTYSAEDFFRMGLVNRVVQPVEFEDELDRFAAKLTGNSSKVMYLAKLATLTGIKNKPEVSAKKIDEVYAKLLMNTHDAVEGLTAFLEKRKPEWQDR